MDITASDFVMTNREQDISRFNEKQLNRTAEKQFTKDNRSRGIAGLDCSSLYYQFAISSRLIISFYHYHSIITVFQTPGFHSLVDMIDRNTVNPPEGFFLVDDHIPRFTSSYMAERVVGTESLGIVFQAKCLETGVTLTIKKVLQDRRYKNRELQLMRLMGHPNVVSLKHCFIAMTSKDDFFLNLMMEYVPETMHRGLKHYCNANQRMPQIYLKLYTYQMFWGLANIHTVPGVCHRDAKPQNLLTISYMAERVVGTESLRIVFQAKCLETGVTVTVKKVLQDRRYKNRGLQLMRLMGHPNGVSLKHCFIAMTSKDDFFLNLMMEYVPETMHRGLKHYCNANQRMLKIYLKLYTYQMFWGLANIHTVPGVCHRDAKPQNLLHEGKDMLLPPSSLSSTHGLKGGFVMATDSCTRARHVGLVNRGLTCFMNAILQSLFHIPYFRQVVCSLPKKENGLVYLALQKLFLELQLSDKSVETKELAKFFRREFDPSQQHDAHEFNRVLMEKLKDHGADAKSKIEELFQGRCRSKIQCIHVKDTSTTIDPFEEISLKVEGCKDVYESLDKYIEDEYLNDKYKTEQYGMQDATKTVLFDKFPPVLQLHLLRFKTEADGTFRKVNTHYEYPLQLDLDVENRKYLSPEAGRSIRNLYTLHSVIVHSGEVTSGHYYSYIRPTLADECFKFNDESVIKEASTRAMEQYGGQVEKNPGFSNANAYMLVYIRESEKDKVMCDVKEKEIPKYLQERLQKEKEDLEEKLNNNQEKKEEKLKKEQEEKDHRKKRDSKVMKKKRNDKYCKKQRIAKERLQTEKEDMEEKLNNKKEEKLKKEQEEKDHRKKRDTKVMKKKGNDKDCKKQRIAKERLQREKEDMEEKEKNEEKLKKEQEEKDRRKKRDTKVMKKKRNDKDCKKQQIAKTIPGGLGLPLSIDWSLFKVISGVWNQGKFGVCWAIALTNSLEAIYNLYFKDESSPLVELSPQSLVDNISPPPDAEIDIKGGFGCSLREAFKHVATYGVPLLSDYPYIGERRKTPLPRNPAWVIKKIKKWKCIYRDEEEVKHVLVFQPVVALLKISDDLYNLGDGIYMNIGDPKEGRHAVLITGYDYDREAGVHFLRFLNSWGINWGVNGYGKVCAAQSLPEGKEPIINLFYYAVIEGCIELMH